MIPEAKNLLCDNAALELDKRVFGGVDCTWSKEEFLGMVHLAAKLKQDDIMYILCGTRA